MKTTRITLTVACFLRLCLTASATLHYVDLNSTNPVPPFANWATAALTIQDAVDAASSGDTVLVSNGIYATGGRTVPANTLTNRVVLDKAVTLQSLNGPAVTTIQGAGPTGANAIRCVYLTSGAVLSGFELTLGATGTNNDFINWNSAGGGAWCASPNAVVSNCVVSGNVAYGTGGGGYGGTWNNCTISSNSAASGGGVSSATLRNCTLTRNLATYGGGGTSQSKLTNCSLVSNSANDGGGNWAGWVTNSTLTGNWAKNGGASGEGTLVGCIISNNWAEIGGGTYFGTLITCTLVSNSAHWGGGMYESTLTSCALIGNVATFSTNYNNGATGGGAYRGNLIHCTLLGNMATNEFGILNRYSYGGGVSWSVLNNCTLKSNVAVYGGGAYSATLTNCVLSRNSAGSGGGTAAGTLFNCLLSSNSTSGFGGGGADGSALNNCTVVGNSANNNGYGGGTYSGVLNNCIVYYNSGNFGANHSSATLNYCCTTPLPSGGIGLTNAPLFIDMSDGSNLRLQSNSPCIDAGSNNFSSPGGDLDGRPRIVGATVDIGAYEFQGDGMSEFIGWLQEHSLPTSGAADYADADSDWLNNRQEWIAGTNPTNALSVLRMLSPSSTAFVGFVSWQSVTGRNYFLQRAPNLHALSTFVTLQSNIVGQANVTSFADASATNGGSYFYRVGIEAW